MYWILFVIFNWLQITLNMTMLTQWSQQRTGALTVTGQTHDTHTGFISWNFLSARYLIYFVYSSAYLINSISLMTLFYIIICLFSIYSFFLFYYYKIFKDLHIYLNQFLRNFNCSELYTRILLFYFSFTFQHLLFELKNCNVYIETGVDPSEQKNLIECNKKFLLY